jgi:hypothetical protein
MTDEQIREKLKEIDPLWSETWLAGAVGPARAALEAPTLVEAEEILFKAGWGLVVETARELRHASVCKACHGRGFV